MIEQPKQAEVIVIGGGVIGCAIAWRLAQSRLNVLVIERGQPGHEASWAAGGMLAPFAEADRADEFLELCVASRAMYADFARELQTAAGLDIEYRTEGTLYLSITETDDEELEHRWRWQHAAGLKIKKLNADCVRKLEPQLNDKLRWALKFPDDHQVDNRRLSSASFIAAQAAGAQFLTCTEVTKLLTESHAGQRRVTGVMTPVGEIKTQTVILAAGSWSSLLDDDEGNRVARFKIKPVRGQMAAIENLTPPLRHVVYSRRAYLVPRHSGFVIAGSTSEKAGYDKSVTAGGLASILARAIEIAPGLQQQPLLETWAGLRPKGPDNLPLLGRDPRLDGLVYATAHYRNGILLTPITAKAICELIVTGESSIDLTTFSVARFSRRASLAEEDNLEG